VLYNKAKLTYYWSPVVYTEVSDIEKSTSISIYPNPASEKIRINGLSSGIKTQVQIHDLSGKLVLNREIDSAEEIEIGELISGVYFVTLKNDTIHSYEKLIVR
jgi:hypothetical protein